METQSLTFVKMKGHSSDEGWGGSGPESVAVLSPLLVKMHIKEKRPCTSIVMSYDQKRN